MNDIQWAVYLLFAFCVLGVSAGLFFGYQRVRAWLDARRIARYVREAKDRKEQNLAQTWQVSDFN